MRTGQGLSTTSRTRTVSQGLHKQKETQLDFQAPAKKNNDHLISKLRALRGVPWYCVCGDPRGEPVLAMSLRGVLWIDTVNPVTAFTSKRYIYSCVLKLLD